MPVCIPQRYQVKVLSVLNTPEGGGEAGHQQKTFVYTFQSGQACWGMIFPLTKKTKKFFSSFPPPLLLVQRSSCRFDRHIYNMKIILLSNLYLYRSLGLFPRRLVPQWIGNDIVPIDHCGEA